MAFKDLQNPITVDNMLRNILCKAGDYGRAWKVTLIEGTVVGVPQQPLDQKGFRNLLNLAIGLGQDNKPALRVYLNQGVISNAFKPPSYDNKFWKVINSVFVTVRPDNGDPDVVCVNFAGFDLQPTTTPAPTPTSTPTPTPTPTSQL